MLFDQYKNEGRSRPKETRRPKAVTMNLRALSFSTGPALAYSSGV